MPTDLFHYGFLNTGDVANLPFSVGFKLIAVVALILIKPPRSSNVNVQDHRQVLDGPLSPLTIRPSVNSSIVFSLPLAMSAWAEFIALLMVKK